MGALSVARQHEAAGANTPLTTPPTRVHLLRGVEVVPHSDAVVLAGGQYLAACMGKQAGQSTQGR